MSNTGIVVITIVVFVGVLLVGTFVYWSARSRREAHAREMARRIGTVLDSPEESLFRLTSKDPLAEAMGNIGRQLDILLKQADAGYDLTGLFFRMGVFALVGAVSFSIVLQNQMGILGVFAGGIPVLMLTSRANERAAKLSEQLPDSLDLVGRSLQAGHGLSDAMRLCAEEMPMPVAQEFGRVFEEHNLGRDFRDCLNDLADRNPRNFDLKIFVSSVLLQRDTGGNLIEILNNIAQTIRDRFVFHAKVKALTAEARFSAIILGGLPFVVTALILYLRPEYLNPLLDDIIGNVMLGIAVTLFTSGMVVMRILSQIDV